jgi:hypothetical protein
MKHLRKMMREVVAHLDTILDNVEESWEPFGLVPPSLQLPPGGIWPLNLVPLPTEDGSGKLQVTWGQAPRALYYEVFLQTGGGPKEFQFVDSIAATELVLENLPVNTRIRVWVVPVNLAGQGLGMEKEVALGG